MSSIGKLMKQATRMQEKIERVQSEIADKTVEANPVSVPDFFATIHAAVGVDHTKSSTMVTAPSPTTASPSPRFSELPRIPMSHVVLPFRLHLRIPWAALVLWCVCATTARAEIRVTPWRAAFQGVELADGTADAAEPRIQRVFAARIQLDSPGLKFFSTPRGGTLETLGETASTFLTKHRLQLAINANFYEPVSNTPVDINLEGLAISARTVVSPPSPGLPALCLTEDNHARLVENTPTNFPTAGISTAIAGSRIILREGRPIARSSAPDDVHPRTAVGLSHDGRVLIWLVIDGRQPGYSLGASVEETALWLARLGAHSGLMLDGGGSTTLVRADRDGRATLLNRPIHKNTPGRERLNGNHLGLRAAPLPPARPPAQLRECKTGVPGKHGSEPVCGVVAAAKSAAAPAIAPRLYNLDTDIGETSDVAAQHPDVVKRLQDLIAKMGADLGLEKTNKKNRAPGVREAGQVKNPVALIKE